MKDTKRIFRNFSFFDFDGIRLHLENCARQGWMLYQTGKGFWRYRRIEPKDIKFAVTYFPKASDFDAEMTEELEDFNEFCASAGWQHVASMGQMQIYCNENENPVPIETDPVVQVNTIHAAMKKNFIPSYIFIIVMALIVIAMQIGRVVSYPISAFSDPSAAFIILVYISLVIISSVELAGYYSWRKKAVRRAEEGFAVPSGKTPRLFNNIMLAAITVIAVMFFATEIAGIKIEFYLFIYLVAGSGAVLALSMKKLLKKLHFSRLANQIITFGISVAVPMILLIFSVHFIVSNDISISTKENKPVGSYEWMGISWDIYNDPVPLKLEDFMDTGYDSYSYENRDKGSFLLTEFEVHQDIRAGETGYPELKYDVVKVHADFLYDICFDHMFKELDDSHREMPQEHMAKLTEQDAAPWQAEAVYRVKSYEGYIHNYLLCYSDKIVSIRLYGVENDLTPRQMSVIGRKLKEI